MSNPTAPAHAIAATGDPLLLTPGPLTNSRTVKEAMLHDWGSRDGAFVAINGEVLAWLPGVVHAATSHVAVPLQGSGRCAVEAMLTDFAPTCGEVLLLIDRACGHRARKIPAIAASSNTCIERVPGRGFALCRHEALAAARGNATTLVPDPHDQWAGPQQTGHYRCAPLRAAALQAPIIVTFRLPRAPGIAFHRFRDGLGDRGFVIYPGKLTVGGSFRIGCIGHLFPSDLQAAPGAVREVLAAMNVATPLAA